MSASMERPRLRSCAVLFALLATLTPAPALASWAPQPILGSPAPPRARIRGRPKVVLDQLEFPSDVAQAPQYKSHLRTTLAKVTRRADWGAGAKNRIEYRFFVTELTFIEEEGVLRVRCTAIGKLPKGKTAKSRLSFSGEPAQAKRARQTRARHRRPRRDHPSGRARTGAPRQSCRNPECGHPRSGSQTD